MHTKLLLFTAFLSCLTHAVKSTGQTPLRNLVCIDVKSQDPFIDRRTRFGMSRGFHLFADDIADANNGQCPPSSGFPQKIRWNPSRNGNKYISYDEFYAKMPQRTLAVLHGNAPFMSGGLFGKPICPDVYPQVSNHSLPSSYLINSIRSSLFSARYGTAPAAGFPAGFNAIAGRYVESPDNQMANGNGTVKYIEMFNEADNTWSDGLDSNNPDLYPGSLTQFYFSPVQYAALLSAAYDGNCNAPEFKIKDANGNDVPGAFWGIKNLSPGTKVVMAGTSDLRGKWISDMANASLLMRPSCNSLPFDVVNYHFYSTPSHPAVNTGDWSLFYDGKKIFGANTGVFPESSNIKLKERLSFVLEDQNPVLKSLPVWITEFGYSAAASGVGPGFGDFDPPTIQGQWLTRYILETSTVKDGSGRGIERLFIYDLNDDLGAGGFAFHGIQQLDGTPKKGWYHLMTMLNVLGDRWYLRNNSNGGEQFFEDVAPNTALPADDPRIYLYGTGSTNLTNRTYALWVPSGEDKRYQGKLKITGNWQTKPKVQKIEVLDYDEDGKRTMIPPADIEFTQGVEIVINNLLLTETPKYLRFVNSNFSDPVVPPVSNLAAACFGCKRTRLTWTTILNPHYTFYQIYYAPVGSYPGSPDHFDLAYAHLYGDKLSGNATSVYVSLPPDNYYFWVVPYRTVYDHTLGQHVMVAPDLTGNLTPASSYYVEFDATVCTETPCAATLSPANITNLAVTQPSGNVVPNFGNNYYQQGFTEALIPIPTADLCAEMNGGSLLYTPGAATGIQLSPNDPNSGSSVSFVVNFNPLQYINAIQMYLFGGRAQVTIEFMEDCCEAYYEVKKYDFGGNTPQWVTLTNSSPKKRIEKVRITIKVADIAGGGVTIGRLLFCTSPAVELCRVGGGDESLVAAATPPSDLQAMNIDTRSATVSFRPATRTSGDESSTEPEPVYTHTLKYGIALNEQGEIMEAQEITVTSDDYGAATEASLSKLAPNTTYIVDVLATVACNETQQQSRIFFTTLPETDGQEERSAQATGSTVEIRLMPNPVKRTLHLDIPEGGYSGWRVVSVNGALLQSGYLSQTATFADLDVQNLPAGIHIIVLYGTGKQQWSKGFLKIE